MRTPTYTPAYGTHYVGNGRSGTLVPRPEDANPAIADDALWIKWDDDGSVTSFSQDAFLGFFNVLGLTLMHDTWCTCSKCWWGVARSALFEHYVVPHE